MYHQTTSLFGNQLQLFSDKATKQEELILEIFRKYKKLTPSECHEIFLKYRQNTPLTSIRRGISDLTKEGKLMFSNETKKGIYGRTEHYWNVL